MIAFIFTVVICFGFLFSGFRFVLDLVSGWAPRATGGRARVAVVLHALPGDLQRRDRPA